VTHAKNARRKKRQKHPARYAAIAKESREAREIVNTAHWCCFNCGRTLQRVLGVKPIEQNITVHEGTCDVCTGENVAVANTRDFVYGEFR
jgi:hypothetical protein